jgi:hypothetical protein
MSTFIPEPAEQQRHLNKPQLRALAIDAHTQVHMWGRRTGKTEGPGGAFTARRVHDMPRANGILMGTTYEQLLTRTIPPLVAAWEKLGYYQDVHYWVRKRPPAGLRIPKAYRTPLKYDNYIQWYNGSGMYLVSQDRPGSINGISSQWLYGDEAKFLNVERLREEAMITLSGMRDLFGHLPHYLATCFMSDMPLANKGNWLFEYEAKMESEACELVLRLVMEYGRIEQLLPQLNTTQQRKAQRELAKLQGHIDQLRTGLTHYSEASTLDNVHVLGLNTIKQMRRDLPNETFQSSVMNKRVVQVANGFYASLNEDYHGYHAHNYRHIDNLVLDYKDQPDKNSLWDEDVNPREPLDIGLDYNNIFNSLTVGQPHGREYRLVNSLFVDSPLLLDDVVQKFCDYYRHHQAKHVRFFFDHTAVAVSANKSTSYADDVCNILYANGWTVERCYLGQAWKHYARFLLWGKLLRELDSSLFRFRFNLTNARQWMISAQGAKTKRSGEEWKKDKDSEKVIAGKPVMPPRDATHLSEAADMLIVGAVTKWLAGSMTGFVDTLMG